MKSDDKSDIIAEMAKLLKQGDWQEDLGDETEPISRELSHRENEYKDPVMDPEEEFLLAMLAKPLGRGNVSQLSSSFARC